MKRIVVAGHLCVDLIPDIPPQEDSLRSLFVPGKLVDVGPIAISTGGAVANTGLALAKLGAPVRLVALVGDDSFGREARAIIARAGGLEKVDDALVVDPGVATSYTVVINVPGADRVFLHCPGANDRFGPDTVADRAFDGAGLLHFGYPPLMRRFYQEADDAPGRADGAQAMAELFGRARQAGLLTSLDMALADSAGPAGRVDWKRWLARVLPLVDIFTPSLDELANMLHPGQLKDGAPDPAFVRSMAEECLSLGAAVVALKLGSHGLYLRATSDGGRWDNAAWPFDDAVRRAWRGAERHSPCFRVDVVGTTGSGDCTVAGLLFGLMNGFEPDRALEAAVAVGACNVEAADAISGIRPWKDVSRRLADGWSRHDDGLFS